MTNDLLSKVSPPDRQVGDDMTAWFEARVEQRLWNVNKLVAALRRPLKLTSDGECGLRAVLLFMCERYEIEAEAPNYYEALHELSCKFGDDLPHDGAESDLYPHLLQASLARLYLGSEVAQSLGLDRQHWPIVIRLIKCLEDRYMHEDVSGKEGAKIVELVVPVLARGTLNRGDLRVLLRTIRSKRPQRFADFLKRCKEAQASACYDGGEKANALFALS